MTTILFVIVRISWTILNKLSKNINTFSNILFNFWSLHQVLNILKQGCTSYFLYFGSYILWKGCLPKRINSPVSENHSTANMLEGPKRLWNLHEVSFIKLCCISEGDWLRKSLLLMIFELLRLFVKTLTGDNKYSLCDIWNLQDLIQIHLSKKVKTFCWIFPRLLKSTSGFSHFEKRYDSHSLCNSETTDCQRHI